MEFFFKPKSVAIVGASANPMKFGSVIMTNLFNLGYEGKIFPVNPKGGEIAGLKTYTSVRHIPEEIDLAVPAAADHPDSGRLAIGEGGVGRGVRQGDAGGTGVQELTAVHGGLLPENEGTGCGR